MAHAPPRRPRPRRYARRGASGLAAVLAAVVVVVPLSLGYVYTHLQRAQVPENRLGMASENVAFETSDGLTLKGWYVPSRNGAAVIAFPGRKGPQPHARMLARHGYGVLLFDRRGEGASDGDPNAFGWGGEKDIEAAVAYLRDRPDVDPDRIGGIGLSVGGELLLQAAAGHPALGRSCPRAPDTARSARAEDMPGARVDTLVGLPARGHDGRRHRVLQPRAARRPRALRRPDRPAPAAAHRGPEQRAHRGAQRRLLRRGRASPRRCGRSPAPATSAASTRAAEYERRVVGFFDRALRTS